MLYTDQTTVTIKDINYGNHLDHASLVILLHETRLRFLKSINLGEQLDETTILVVRDLYVRYKNASVWGDQLNIVLETIVERPFLRFNYSVTNQENRKKIAEAKITMVPINVKTGAIEKQHHIYELLT